MNFQKKKLKKKFIKIEKIFFEKPWEGWVKGPFQIFALKQEKYFPETFIEWENTMHEFPAFTLWKDLEIKF